MKLLNLFLFTFISVCALYLSPATSLIQAFFIIACISCLIMFLFLSYKFIFCNDKSIFKLYDIKLSIIRAIFNIIGVIYWLEAVKHLGPNEATAIGYMTPIFTSILAYIFCDETPTFEVAGAILVGFLGMYITIQPNIMSTVSYGATFSIISSIGFAMHDVLCKKQTSRERCATQSFYHFANIAMITGPFAFYNWVPVSMSDMKYIILMAIASSANIAVLFLAYKLAPVMILMPFSYCRLVFMGIATYFLFGDIPSRSLIVGAIIISIASSYIFYKQNAINVSG